MATMQQTEADVQVRDAVMRQLEWDPALDASAVGVTAHGGAVTLTGFIDTYAGKLAAERAAKRIRGVRAVANEIQVRLKLGRTDPQIAEDVVRALRLRSSVPEEVQASVHKAHVTLTGRVYWLFQKGDAERAVRHVAGVRGIFNHITVTPFPTQGDVRRRIFEALRRDANVDAGRITIALDGDTAVLGGFVRSWLERDSAEQAASSAPGIARVNNRIIVDPLPAPIEDDTDEMC